MVVVPSSIGQEDSTMRYRAELRCYLCSRNAATLEWEAATPNDVSVTRPGVEVAHMDARNARRVRCVRCGGPAFVEEIEKLRAPMVVKIEPAKRGRPRKADKERELALEQELLARIA
jgi:hypothetical protein